MSGDWAAQNEAFQLEAVVKERDELRAEIARLTAENARMREWIESTIAFLRRALERQAKVGDAGHLSSGAGSGAGDAGNDGSGDGAPSRLQWDF
jgi:hypothetical protein